jgi:hypothetical protein
MTSPSLVKTPLQLVEAFVHAIEHSILPLTRVGVAGGNKVFGAAILGKKDLSLVLGATNFETSSPLLVSIANATALGSEGVGRC